MSKLEQIKNLKGGSGLAQLLDEGERILGNPLVLFDTTYTLIAFAGDSADDPINNELISIGTFSIETQRFFMNECFTDVVANAETLAMMHSDKLKYRRVLGHIFNGDGVKVANVLMLEYDKPFNNSTLSAFELLADLLSQEIRNDEAYIAYGEAYFDSWIRRLIDNNIEEKRLYTPHVQILYNGFCANLYLAVVDLSIYVGENKDLSDFINLLRQKRKDFKYAVYNNQITMIISTNYKRFNKKRDLPELESFFEQENVFVGISSQFGNLFELRKYYIEATQALDAVKKQDSGFVSVYKENMT